MKDIFTYPSNASTNYIDPLYDGADNTEGLNKRIDELRLGTYLAWGGASPTKTTAQLMQGYSKYINYIDYFNEGNVKIYDLWENELVEFTMREKGFAVDEVTAVVQSGQGVLRFQTTSNHGLVNGDRINFKDLVDTGGYDIDVFNNTSDTVYAKKISNTVIELYSNVGLTTPYTVDAFESNINDWVMIGDADDGNVVFFHGRGLGGIAPYVDSDAAEVATAMSTVTGTANPTSGSTLYFDKLGTNIYTMKTDSGLTTDAVLSNEQYADASMSIFHYPSPNGTDVSLENVDTARLANYTTAHHTSHGSGSIAAHDALHDFLSNTTGKVLDTSDSNIKTGFVRLFYTPPVAGNYYQTSDSKAASNSSNPTTDEYFVFNYNVSNKTLTICNSWDPNHSQGHTGDIHDYEIYSGSGGSTYLFNVHMRFVDLSIHGGGIWHQPATVSLNAGKVGTHPILQSDGTTPFYEVDTIDIINYGNRTFKQQTGASTFQFNAELENAHFHPGNTSLSTINESIETQATPTITGDGNYYFTGISITNTNQRGTYQFDGTRAIRLKTVADTYTAPALSTEAQEDVFDVDTEWDDTDFDVLKTFPTTVTPQDITVRVVAPTATTSSQNGTKYSRTAGYSKYSIDVTYPPMTAEQYLDYNGFINALNGQKHPFYFDILQNNTQLFGRKGTYGVQGLRYKDAASAGDNVVLIEGFATNQADAVKRGELFVTDTKHGNIKTAGSSTDANAYGEAKFRFTTPLHSNKNVAQLIYNNPQHIIVSLDTDTVEVTRDTAGFYYLSLSFTADEWK